ncbi:MAG: hypothetical protein AAFV07_17280, partial [Bacteroidota bacterium]
MSAITQRLLSWYEVSFSEQTKKRIEHLTVWLAIGSFGMHLLVILLTKLEFISIPDYAALLSNPITAIY